MPCCGIVEAAAAGRVARACAARAAGGRRRRSASPSDVAWSGDSPGQTTSHSMRSAACSQIGASTASRSGTAALMWSLWPWVSTIARTRRPPTASTIGWWSWAASKHDHLAVVADEPDVVGDLPLAAVEGEDAVGGDELDASRSDSTTTERSTSPRSILWNASSTSSRPISSLTNRSRSSRPWRYRSMSIGKSRDGRQSPYQLDLSAPPRPNTSMNGSSMHVGRPGHADEHDGAGEVPRLERLLVDRRVADRLDADVGAEPAGHRADELDGVGASRSCTCGWRRSPSPTRACGRRCRRR